MGLFDKLESRLEHGVNGAFARAFKSEVQPVELAAGMRRAMDDRASSIGKGKRPIVPNLYTFELSPTDYERLVAWGPELDDELIAAAQEHADEQRYIPGGPFTIVLDEADDLETGVFRLRPTTAKAADAQAFAAQYPRQASAVTSSSHTPADDEYDDYRDQSYETYDRDEKTGRNDDCEEYVTHEEVAEHESSHGASRLEDYSRPDYSSSADDDYADAVYDEHAQHDEYVYDDEGDAYPAYEPREDDSYDHAASTESKSPSASGGGMGARIKNYLFGNYAPEPHQEHAGTDHRGNDIHADDVRDDYYPEHDADERGQSNYTSYDDHYGEYVEQDDAQNHRENGERFETSNEASNDYESSYEDDPYEYEHTRPAPQKSASRPVRALPKKRDVSSNDHSFTTAQNEPASAEPHGGQYEDYPIEANDHEQHEGYISYDPEAEHAQRGGYTTYGGSDYDSYEEESAVAPETPARQADSRPTRDNRQENRRPKRDQSRSYSHAWDDDGDYGDPTGYEPAPSTPAPPARRVTSPRERPWLKIDGQRYPLMGAITVIGRDDDADIILDDPGVSRRHSEVRITHDGPHLVMSIRDLGSTNGTYINGDRIESEHLHDGDRLTVGRTSMTIHLGDQP